MTWTGQRTWPRKASGSTGSEGGWSFPTGIVEFSTPSRLDRPLGQKLELVPAQDGRDNALRETSEKHVAVVLDPLR